MGTWPEVEAIVRLLRVAAHSAIWTTSPDFGGVTNASPTSQVNDHT
jgi:hypothetical protein